MEDRDDMTAPAEKPKHIILIEDDDSVRRSLALILRLRGYTVDVFRNGVELLSSQSLPDASCYLIDYKMPSIDGLQLLARLRSNGVTAPAFMITGFHSPGLLLKAIEAGFLDLMEKPVSGQLIAERIAEVA